MSSSSQTIDLYCDALAQYLSGREWQESIEMFVKANCEKFTSDRLADSDGGYSHDHYELWKTFQEIVEQILEMALSNVGGSITKLEKALDKILNQPIKGPRDEVFKHILDQLLSYNDFSSFSSMMNTASTIYEINDSRDNDREVDDGIHFVNEARQGYDDSKSNYAYNKNYNDLVSFGFDESSIEYAIKKNSNASLEELVMILSKLQSEMADNKVAPAKTCHHKKNKNHGPKNSNFLSKFPHLEEFSKHVNEEPIELHAKFVMANSVLDTFHEGVSVSNSVIFMLQWASQMKELLDCISLAFNEKIAFEDVKSIHEHGLIQWYIELEHLRKSIESQESAGAMINDSEMKRLAELNEIASMGTEDEQLLHNLIIRHDEVQKQVNDLHVKCGALVTPGSGIKREDLEELYLYLKEKVASGVNLESITDEMHEKVYSTVASSKGAEVINTLLDMHLLEDEQSLLKEKINSLLNSPSRNNFADEKLSYKSEINDSFATASPKSSAIELNHEDKNNNVYLEQLKLKHKNSLQILKNSIQMEKSRKLNELNARLKQRRELNNDPAEDQPIMDDIADVNSKYDLVTDNLLSGFKKKCIYELKAVKLKGEPLTSDEKDECYRQAANALKQRYERDRKNLLESLEMEKTNGRTKILEKLSKRRMNAKNKHEVDDIEEQCANELKIHNQSFDDQILNTLAPKQMEILLGLASIYMDHDTLKELESSPKGRKLNSSSIDEDDDYLEDSGGKDTTFLCDWINGTVDIAGMYTSAGIQVQRNLYQENSEQIDLSKIIDTYDANNEVKDNEEDKVIIDISSRLTSVVVDAYCNQLSNPTIKSSDMASYIKDNIINQFTKSKGDYDEMLKRAQLSCKNNLDMRRNKKKEEKDSFDEEALTVRLANPFSKINNLKKSPLKESYAYSQVGFVPKSKAGVVLPALKAGNSFNIPLPKINNQMVLDDILHIDARDRIKHTYDIKEQQLIDDLRNKMELKKKLLETRLEKKRDQRRNLFEEVDKNSPNKQADVRNFVVNEIDEDLDQTESQLEHLEAAFKEVVNLLKNQTTVDTIDRVDIMALSDAMESISKGEKITSLPISDHEMLNSHSMKEFDHEKVHMQDEVKRISSMYNEEKQKHDLMLRMQQARQKHTLQRKLLERKNQNSSSTTDIHEFQTNTLNQFSPNSSSQPVIRGMDSDKFISPMKLSSYSNRGLNLTPIMRK